MSFGSRLKQRRESLGITQVQLAERLGVTKGAVGNYETDISSPKADILFRVFDVLQCDANYLFQDEMRIRPDTTTPEEWEFLRKCRSLDAYGKTAVNAVLSVEYERCLTQTAISDAYADVEEDTEAESEAEEKLIELTYFLQPASAGHGNWLEDANADTIRVPDTPTTRRADFAIRVSGRSMEPRYADGDLVFIRRQESVEVGQDGIWIVDGSAYIKQRGTDCPISLNPHYPDVTPTEATYCVGKVIGKL